MRKRSVIFGTLGILILAWAILALTVRPSNNRDWSPDQAVLPGITFGSGTVAITNIRNFTYRTVTDYTPGYYDAEFALQDLERVWYIVEPLGRPGLAHTLVSFEFRGDRFLSISAEIRKEKGETFSPWRGLLRQYEMMYVIGDERDLIGLRANIRKDTVYLYPVIADASSVQKLFVSMLEKAKELQEQPAFYNTLTNNCTNAISGHINALQPGSIPWWSYKLFLPEYSDELAYDAGFLDPSVSLLELRQRHTINDRAEHYADAPDFSVRIRE